MDEYCKRSGQIPAFGDWENANKLPITQYFECARQAGLIRYSSSSGESDHPYVRHGDLYAVDFNKPSRFVPPPPSSRKTTRAGSGVREREKRYSNYHHHHHHHSRHLPQLKEQKRAKKKVCDVTVPSTTKNTNTHSHSTTTTAAAAAAENVAVPPPVASKPIDEDLYKIPPELLLHTSKRKKMLGFFSRCLAPACAA